MDNKYDYLEKVNHLQQEAFRLDKESWFNYELFTLEWWVLLALFIVPWIVWFKLANRSKLFESLLLGMLIIISTTYLDAIGMQLQFWLYPTQFLPLAIRAIPFDMSVVPVLFMLVYQYTHNWRSYVIALTFISAFLAFVGEPISVWMELVIYIKWHYFYSFIYYILIGLTARLVIMKVKKNTQKLK